MLDKLKELLDDGIMVTLGKDGINNYVVRVDKQVSADDFLQDEVERDSLEDAIDKIYSLYGEG